MRHWRLSSFPTPLRRRRRRARVGAPLAQAVRFRDDPPEDESDGRRRARNRAHHLGVLDLFASPAGLADEQHALVGVAEMLAGRIGVEALDLVHEATVE